MSGDFTEWSSHSDGFHSISSGRFASPVGIHSCRPTTVGSLTSEWRSGKGSGRCNGSDPRCVCQRLTWAVDLVGVPNRHRVLRSQSVGRPAMESSHVPPNLCRRLLRVQIQRASAVLHPRRRHLRYASVEGHWYEPDAAYFKVRTNDTKTLLRYEQQGDVWTLQSGFNGDALLSRPGVNLVTVDAAQIREAELKVDGCEHCHADDAEVPFDWILQEITGRSGMVDFVMLEPARCPNCGQYITEKTLVDVAPPSYGTGIFFIAA